MYQVVTTSRSQVVLEGGGAAFIVVCIVGDLLACQIVYGL